MAEKFELFDLILSAYPNFRPWAFCDLRESYYNKDLETGSTSLNFNVYKL